MRTFNTLLTVLALSFSSSIAFTGCATVGGDDTVDTESDATSAGKVDVWQATDGQWHFHLKAGNGAILLTSEAYTSRTGAIAGVLSVLDNGVDTAQYKVVAATHGYLIHLVAGNNEIISFSEVYSTKSNATRAVASCVKATTTYLDKRESITTGARVEVRQGETGDFYFDMFAKNGEIVVASQHYASAASAYNGAFAVQTDGQNAAAYTLKTAIDGSWYWNVTALNGQVVGTSQMYTTKAGAMAAITATQKLMPLISVL